MKSIKQLIEKIEKEKTIIAEHRDKLRDIYEELAMVIYSLDEGLDELSDAKDFLDNAVDKFSEYL